MRAFLVMISLLFSTQLYAACSVGQLSDVSAINAQLSAYSGSGSDLVIAFGDSHTKLTSAAMGPTIYEGRNVLFLGIAGATYQTYLDCFPFAGVAAKSPYTVIFMSGFNDAYNGTCCNPDGSLTATTLAQQASVFAATRALSSRVVWVNDPPQNIASSYNTALFTYTVSEAFRAAAGAEPFYQSYRLFPGSVCYSPFPYCYATGTTDGIHFTPSIYRAHFHAVAPMIGH